MPTATDSPIAPSVEVARPPRKHLVGWLDALLFAAVTFLPLSLGGRGRLNADTKLYLYLDPGELMQRARVMWDSVVGGGTVTHQAIGYLWPMGPYYWLTNDLGIPAWLAQRWWIGGIQFVAALGVLALLRHLLPRHPAQLVGAALYGLSPVILGEATSQSALLLPYAALGWLTLCVVLAVEDGGWRWPAVFALVTATAGSINGSSLFFVLVGALLWLPYAVFGARTASLRAGIATLFRLGSLTLLMSLWWIVAYGVGGAFGLPILAISENVNTTSGPASAAEVLRGLGYWLFYGRVGGTPGLPDLAGPYLTLSLILVSFAVPVLALVLGGLAKWGPRTYFAALALVGTVIAVGAFPSPRSPLGTLFEAASRRSDFVLTLRNTQRATPLVILGLAGLVAAGGIALQRRHARLGASVLVVIAVLIAAALPAQWREGIVAKRFSNDQIPAAWRQVATSLDRGSGRVLELPGIDFVAYRWGTTVDDVLPGLTDRPVLDRELTPLGGPANTSLLDALDRGMEEGTFEPASLAPVARMLGISDVVVRNDLEYERYRTARPSRVWDWVTDPAAGLGTPRTFGDGYVNQAPPTLPMIDDLELALQGRDRVLPEIGVMHVPGGGRRLVSTAPVGDGVVLAGDGEGVVASAAAGLVDGKGSPLLLSTELDQHQFDAVTGPTTRYIVTDTNRKRAQRWYALRENFGATETAGEPAITYQDPSDARLEIVPGAPTSTKTVAEWRGAKRVWASSYGNEFTLLPETRPVNAFDGDPRTAWLIDPHGPAGADPTIGIRLDHPSSADHVTLVQPTIKAGTVATLRARVVLDGTRTFDVDITPDQARNPAGVQVPLDGKPFRELEVHIVDTEPYQGFAGFAEVAIPDVQVQEMIRLPQDLFRKLGDRAGAVPLAVVLTRHRADPAEKNRSDPEWSMLRTFTVDAPLDVALGGTARLHPKAPDARIDQALGLPDAAEGGWTAQATDQVAGSLTQRGSAAFDGDPATWWTTPFDTVAGQAVELDAGRTVRLDSADLTVVTDGEHSTPKRLTVTDTDHGTSVSVDLPPMPAGANGATTQVHVPLPTPVEGQHLRFEITDIEPKFTTDWFTQAPSTLPVSIAEIGVPGLRTRPLPATVDDTCRTDLLTVDGAPVGLKVSGSTTDALAGGGLDVETCDGAPLTLSAGRHDIVAAKGADTGIDLDRLVFTTPTWSAPGATASTDAAPVATVRSIQHHGPARANGTVHTDGSPFWLRLDQSMNKGWSLDIDHAKVDGPIALDSTSTGWLVTPERAGTLAYTVAFTPQRIVDLAVLATALGTLLCFGLVFVGWRRARGRERRAGYRAPELVDAANAEAGASPVTTAAVALATAVVAAIVIHPLASIPAGLLAAVTVWRPRFGRFLPAALLTAAALQVAWFQSSNDYPLDQDWPQHFSGAHVCAFLAVLILAVGAAWDTWGARRDGADAPPGSAGSAAVDDLAFEQVEEASGGTVPREPVGVGDRSGTEAGT